MQKEARMAGHTIAPTPHRPLSSSASAGVEMGSSGSPSHSTISNNKQQQEGMVQQQPMSPPYPPPPHPSAAQQAGHSDQLLLGTDGQGGTGVANHSRDEQGYNYYGAPVPYHLPHGAAGTGVLADGNRTGLGPPLLVPETLGAAPAFNLMADGTHSSSYGGGASSNRLVAGASGIIAPWDLEGDAQGGALSFGFNLGK